ncbi:hypothetical protein BLOT_016385 [Blomia tropicalis]|nr:hypothetical protein BLOT_016385 [Blomia tropicalis]
MNISVKSVYLNWLICLENTAGREWRKIKMWVPNCVILLNILPMTYTSYNGRLLLVGFLVTLIVSLASNCFGESSSY